MKTRTLQPRWRFIVAMFAATAAIQPLPDATAANPSAVDGFVEDPIVLVHGCPLPPATSETYAPRWYPARDYFVAAGYPENWIRIVVFSSATCGSHTDLADELDAVIDDVLTETGAAKVDLVAHSLGALTVRLYIHRYGPDKVRDLVTIGGANHGTQVGLATWPTATARAIAGMERAYEGGREGSPAYACGALAHNDVQSILNGCLTPQGRLDDVDETPFRIEDGGPISYLSIWNAIDELIEPPESACLNQQFMNDCSDPVNVRVELTPDTSGQTTHGRLLSDVEVLELVKAHVTKRNNRTTS